MKKMSHVLLNEENEREGDHKIASAEEFRQKNKKKPHWGCYLFSILS